MQSDQPFLYQDPLFPVPNHMGGSFIHNAPNASAIGGIALPTDVRQPKPFHGVNFQSSEICPKNFIIFDQTVDRRQVMFHPAFAPKFCLPSLNVHSAYANRDNIGRETIIEKELSSSYEEDPDDIDALLSLDEEEEYEEGDEVSTARTQGGYGSDSSDSCSSYASKAKRVRLLSGSLQKSSVSGKSEKKRRKLKKMVKAIRGIVPGGSNQMNTAAVLDEAVRYLKSLKVEMQKMGVTNLK